MLRNRSKIVSTKQSLMADHNFPPSPRPNQNTPNSSFFGSPRIFSGFFSKGGSNSDAETVMTPTSILDSQKVSTFGNPFGYDDQKLSISPTTSKENKHFIEKSDCLGIGLVLIDSLNDEKKIHDNFNFIKPKLNIQIPTLPTSAISPNPSPKSPADFGIKTPNRNSQFLGNPSPFGRQNSGVQTMDSPNNPVVRGLSLSEMELSEDYTCVISHGPNPRTTRIYDNCIVESCCGVVALSDLKKECNLNSPSQSFLNLCHTCKKNLVEGKDVYMYRGEKAFCSNECRCEEMVLDGMKKSEMDNGL